LALKRIYLRIWAECRREEEILLTITRRDLLEKVTHQSSYYVANFPARSIFIIPNMLKCQGKN
jgi:hypothetical protein